jgi:hypothetical protein
MDDYPSIPRATGMTFFEMDNAYLFDKLDGNQIRAHWSRKSGWYKMGTKERLMDATDLNFGDAVALMEPLKEPIEKILRKERLMEATCYLEMWSALSLAGVHVPGVPKLLTLLDVAVPKRGLIHPRDFVKLFAGQVPIATFLGREHWTRGFVERVWRGEVEGVTFEGVVGKTGEGSKRLMSKAKTERWINATHARYDAATAKKIVES